MALMMIKDRKTKLYAIPVPMSVDPGPYGPPKPSGTAQIRRLSMSPLMYASFLRTPRTRVTPSEISSIPIPYTNGAAFPTVTLYQKLNQGCSHAGWPADLIRSGKESTNPGWNLREPSINQTMPRIMRMNDLSQ